MEGSIVEKLYMQNLVSMEPYYIYHNSCQELETVDHILRNS